MLQLYASNATETSTQLDTLCFLINCFSNTQASECVNTWPNQAAHKMDIYAVSICLHLLEIETASKKIGAPCCMLESTNRIEPHHV